MAAPTVVAGFTIKVDTNNLLTRTINVPTNAAGDIIVLAVATDANTGTISAVGFPNYIYQDKPIKTSGNSTVALAGVMWKVSTGDAGTYTIDTSTSERIGAICFAVRGADTSAIHAVGTEVNGDSTTATVPAVITSVADCLRISIVGVDGTTQTTPHGTADDHTKIGEAPGAVPGSTAGTVSAHYKTIATASTDPTKTVSMVATEQWIGFSFAIAPAGGSVTVAPSAASVTSSAVAPTVILGSLSIAPGIASAVATALAPTVINVVTLTPSAAQAATSAVSPTVVLGSTSASPSAASVVTSAVAPTVVLGSIVVSPAVASISSSAVAPTVVLGSIAITPGAASVATSAVPPSYLVLFIAVALTLPDRNLGLTVGNRELTLTIQDRDLQLSLSGRYLSLSLQERYLSLTLRV
jgi:hypothetical protein